MPDGMVEVHCSCGRFMGHIIEGSKLRKGWKIICEECQTSHKTLVTSYELLKVSHRHGKSSPYGDNPFADMFGDILKGKK